jgi:energy-coupling factor transporter transmembrane protein EcfT
MAVDVARPWVAVGVFSMVVVLAVWLWKRPFRWFWIPLAFVPYLGPVFFAGPATWVLANGRTRPAVPTRLRNVVTSRFTRRS